MKDLKATSSCKQLKVLEGATESSHHSFDDEEKEQFVFYINNALREDSSVEKRIPIAAEGNALFEQTRDGIILSKLINNIVPYTIDERVLNRKETLNRFEMVENNNIVISSAKAIGCNIINIDTNDLMDKKEHLVLGILWQIIKKGLLSRVGLNHHPELSRLLEKDEDLQDMLKLSSDAILLRWFNYHLKNSKCGRTVTNLSSDIRDSVCYVHLLNQIAPERCGLDALQEEDMSKRAARLLKSAEKLGCKKYITEKAILEGNPRLNLAFVANLFNEMPGLKALSKEEEKEIDKSLFNFQENREERAFSLWLLSITHEQVQDLVEDLSDGLILLRALDTVLPGTVNWNRVNRKKPMTRFQALENTNYVIDISKKNKMSLIGTQGADITDKVKTLVLGLVWQIMKIHILNTLSVLSNAQNKEIKDSDLIEKANELVACSGKKRRIKTFKDKELCTSCFLIDLIDSIKPGTVDYSLVFEGDGQEELRQNAMYAISLARKIGAVLFLLPEDIIEVKSRMLLVFVASLLEINMRNK